MLSISQPVPPNKVNQGPLSPWSIVPEDRKCRSDLLAPLTPESEQAPHSNFLLCALGDSPCKPLLGSLEPSWPVSSKEPQDSEGSKAASMAKLAVLLAVNTSSFHDNLEINTCDQAKARTRLGVWAGWGPDCDSDTLK